jgi:hypothetical protein
MGMDAIISSVRKYEWNTKGFHIVLKVTLPFLTLED